MRIGLKEIIEDYVHDDGLKIAALLLATFFAVGIGLACDARAGENQSRNLAACLKTPPRTAPQASMAAPIP